MICECCQQRITKKNLYYPDSDYIEIKIMNAVCEYYGIQQKSIEGKSRIRNISEARFIFIYMLYTDPHSRISMSAIGKLLNRDHTTIIHSLKQVTNWLQIDEDFRNNYHNIHLKVYSENDEFIRKINNIKEVKC